MADDLAPSRELALEQGINAGGPDSGLSLEETLSPGPRPRFFLYTPGLCVPFRASSSLYGKAGLTFLPSSND